MIGPERNGIMMLARLAMLRALNDGAPPPTPATRRPRGKAYQVISKRDSGTVTGLMVTLLILWRDGLIVVRLIRDLGKKQWQATSPRYASAQPGRRRTRNFWRALTLFQAWLAGGHSCQTHKR
jgi:hypothetical protein